MRKIERERKRCGRRDGARSNTKEKENDVRRVKEFPNLRLVKRQTCFHPSLM